MCVCTAQNDSHNSAAVVRIHCPFTVHIIRHIQLGPPCRCKFMQEVTQVDGGSCWAKTLLRQCTGPFCPHISASWTINQSTAVHAADPAVPWCSEPHVDPQYHLH